MSVALLLPMELVAMHVYIPLGIPCLQTAHAPHNYVVNSRLLLLSDSFVNMNQ